MPVASKKTATGASMTNALKVSSRDELIAFIPHALGFAPRGMVCLAIGGGPTARVDIPDSPEGMGAFLEVLTDVYLHTHHPRRIALVAFGADGPSCVRALSALRQALTAAPADSPEVGPIFWVNGERWVDVVDGASGTVDPRARVRMDAEFALLGRAMPASRREDLAAEMKGDSTTVALHLPDAHARILNMGVGARRAEAEWVGARVKQFVRDRTYLSDAEAARLLAAMQEGESRDAALTQMECDNAPTFSELWCDLVRRAPSGVRDTPAALLALSSYLAGNGAHAWVAIDQLTEPHPLAEVVAAALDQAANPRVLELALHTDRAGAFVQQAVLHDGIHRPPDRGREATGAQSVEGDGPGPSAPAR